VNIGVFSKFAMAGGSEFRAAELATGISKYAGNEAFLLAEGDIPDRVLERVGEKVHVVSSVLTKKQNVDILYEMDCIIVVNTDCTVFTSEGYWSGNTGRHGARVDLARIKKLAFIFNFIVSPATKLISLFPLVDEIFIVTTNRRFLRDIGSRALCCRAAPSTSAPGKSNRPGVDARRQDSLRASPDRPVFDEYGAKIQRRDRRSCGAAEQTISASN
jgi:hypothetical protein